MKEFEQRLPELRFVGCLDGNLRVRMRITCVLSFKKQVILLQCVCNILGIKKYEFDQLPIKCLECFLNE